MAAIDKLYLDYYDTKEFLIWCIIHKPSLLNNIYDPFMSEWENNFSIKKPIAFLTKKQDRYLYWKCPYPFIREYLKEQCGYKDNWFVKLFFVD